jgi:hypothetical protein
MRGADDVLKEDKEEVLPYSVNSRQNGEVEGTFSGWTIKFSD